MKKAATTARAKFAPPPPREPGERLEVLIEAMDAVRTVRAGFDHHLVKPLAIQAVTGICRRGPRPFAEDLAP